jgi:hypothetical protein
MYRNNITTNEGKRVSDFKPLTLRGIEELKNNNIYKFDQAFGENVQIIGKTNFNNDNNLLHNNISDNVLNEYISEYQIYIDSRDRDIDSYKSQFNFTVYFGVGGNQSDKNGKLYEGLPNPKILREFKNIKFIRLNYIFVPRILKVRFNKYNEYVLDNDFCYKYSKYEYLIVKIKELSDEKILSTNNIISDDSFVFYPHKVIGGNYVMWICDNPLRIYKISQLANISQLTILVITPSGELLTIKDQDGCNLKDERNILFDNFQFFISLTFGTIENEINTNIKFEN